VSFENELLKEAMQTLKHCVVDADKIMQQCERREITISHVRLAAGNLRDMAFKEYERIEQILANPVKESGE
jgi:hypothetical protein